MAGILNSKERMIDFIVTKQGRKQMSDGRMRVEFASITDSHTFYQTTGSSDPSVAEDASNRIFFEASDRLQDLIVPELDAGYSMQPFKVGDFSISGRKIASGTFRIGDATGINVLSGSKLVEDAPQQLMTSIATNFKELNILGTEDVFSDTSDFNLTAHTASFVLTDNDLDFPNNAHMDLENIPNIFNSYRFSHLPNFKYLPPINVAPDPNDKNMTVPLGNYPNLSAGPAPKTKAQLLMGLHNLQKLEFSFNDTSRENNLIAQIFEFNNTEDSIEKLSIIDYGEFSDNDPESPGFHVYFIGKIRKDELGCQTFINLFTVVFE